MRQLNDPVWLKKNADIDCDGWVEAGDGLQPYVAALKQLSVEDMRKIKAQAGVLSMLLPGLRNWMESWGLGASFEAVYIEAQTLLFYRIQKASFAQEDWFEELAGDREGGRARCGKTSFATLKGVGPAGKTSVSTFPWCNGLSSLLIFFGLFGVRNLFHKSAVSQTFIAFNVAFRAV